MRNRHSDFLEYVYRPNVKYNAKVMLPGLFVDNRVGREEYLKSLKKATYSIVIADIDYNDVGFITMRHYENAMNGVISFIDHKYDRYFTMISAWDWRRVTSFVDMMAKIKELEENPVKKSNILDFQKTEILDSYISGKACYDILID